MHLIEKELKRVVIKWNTHRIAVRHNRQGVAGIPDVLFSCRNKKTHSYHAGICAQYLRIVETELELAGGEPDVYE